MKSRKAFDFHQAVHYFHVDHDTGAVYAILTPRPRPSTCCINMDSSDHNDLQIQRLQLSDMPLSPSIITPSADSEEVLPGDADEHDARTSGDSIVQSQLAILEQIQRENELRKKAAVMPHELGRCISAPVPVMNLPSVSRDDRADDNSDLFRAQERLLERFRKQKEEREMQEKKKQEKHLEAKSSGLKVTLVSREIVKPCEPFLPRSYTEPMVPSSPLRSDNDTIVSCPDHCARLGKKKFIVRGTDHTYQAIQSGASSIVDCVACGQALQVPVTAKAVYCTCCHHISSIERKTTL